MKESPVVANTWAALRRLTPARIALGRAGSGLPTAELLRFGLAHARARDAVHAALDAEALARRLAELGLSPTIVKSAAMNRETYLRRPDLGRRLAPDAAISKSDQPFALVIADGLSALAVERHAVPLHDRLVGHVHPLGSGDGDDHRPDRSRREEARCEQDERALEIRGGRVSSGRRSARVEHAAPHARPQDHCPERQQREQVEVVGANELDPHGGPLCLRKLADPVAHHRPVRRRGRLRPSEPRSAPRPPRRPLPISPRSRRCAARTRT